MRSILMLGVLLISWSAQAQTPPPQMPPPPPTTQGPPTAPTPVKPLSVKPTVKSTKAKSSNCRDATSGKFVTAAYAKKNPTTTVCETTK